VALFSSGRSQLAFWELRPAKMLLFAALKAWYWTALPEWMATTPKYLLVGAEQAAAEAVAAAEAARTKLLICILSGL
jgi:hypothetical protein